MKHKFLFILGVVTLLAKSSDAQTCNCDQYHRKIYSLYNGKILQLRICGDLVDSYNSDKIIAEFFIMDCRQDTMVENQIHNEGQVFLLKPLNQGFSIVSIDVPADEKDPIPQKFQSITWYTINGKLKVRNEEISSKPIVQYLKKFKEYQKIK